MSRRLIVIAGIAAAVIALFSALSATAPAAAPRSCGRVVGTSNVAYRVQVGKGSVSCREARTVIRAYNSGKGTLHKPSHGGRGNWVTALRGGWSCVSGAGGESCSRGPKINRYERRDQVWATPE